MHQLLTTLASHATLRTFKKGSILLYQGEAPRMAYVVKSGDVKVYTITNNGEERIVTMHSAGDMFPGSWIFAKSTTAMYYYETSSACQIFTVARDELHKLIDAPDFLPHVVDYLATNYAGLLMRVTALQQSRASEKIMLTLYYLLFRYGTEIKPGLFELRLQLTHTTIASLVGLTRETTTTELNRLKGQKIVSYSRGTYTIDKHRLERTMGEDSFADALA